MKDFEEALKYYCMMDVHMVDHFNKRYEVVVNMGGDNHESGYQILLVKEKTFFQDTKKILFAESKEGWGYSFEVGLKLFEKQLQGARELAAELNGEYL